MTVTDITWHDLARAFRRRENLWEELDSADQAALLAYLQAVVPRWDGRYLREDEVVGPGLPEAAKILQVGELEAAIAGDPKTPWREWKATRKRVTAALQPLAKDNTSTGVDAPPAIHVAQVEEAARQIDRMFGSYLFGITNRKERAFIRTAIARAALAGFSMGQDAQLALRAPLLMARDGHLKPLIESETARQQAERIRDAETAKVKAVDHKLRLVQTVIQRNRGKGGQTTSEKWEDVRAKVLQVDAELLASWSEGSKPIPKARAHRIHARVADEKGRPAESTIVGWLRAKDSAIRKGRTKSAVETAPK